MPELEYFIVAESVATDRERNTVSVFHVIEEWACSLPAVVPKVVAVSSWRVSPEEIGRDFQVALDVQLPGGERLPREPNDMAVNFTAQSSGHRIYQTVTSLRIEAHGEIVFRILINGEHAATRVIRVRERDEAT